jgi:hypothetical protein
LIAIAFDPLGVTKLAIVNDFGTVLLGHGRQGDAIEQADKQVSHGRFF